MINIEAVLKERRNLSPHAEAIVAMHLWGSEYAAQRLGCMDWWDSLPERRKGVARELLDRIGEAKREGQI